MVQWFSGLDNTACNTETGACECDTSKKKHIYSPSTNKWEKLKIEYLFILFRFYIDFN